MTTTTTTELKMTVLMRKHLVNVKNFRDKLLFEKGIKNFRFLKKGKSLITSMKLIQFQPYIINDEPALYIKSLPALGDAPFVLQSDRIIVEAENKTKATDLLDTFISQYDTMGALQIDLNELIKGYEDKNLEFKSTYRYDIIRKVVNTDLEKEILRAICAFLNAEGGILIIGVSDERQIIGLSHDFQTLKNKNRDGLENHLRNRISSMIGNKFMKVIDLSFHEIEGKEICKVKVDPSNEEVYLTENGEQKFYVRFGHSSRSLSIPDATKYIKDRWR